MLTMRQDVLYGNSVTSEVKFKTVTSKSMGKIDGKNNYEESKYMRKGTSLNIPILHSSIWSLDALDVEPLLRPLRPRYILDVGRRPPPTSTASTSRDSRITDFPRSCAAVVLPSPHLPTTCFQRFVAVTISLRSLE
ncbi:hypothetical protein M501DRAFT_22302 [Patellaria atrata CBS 101060]|uniref:Uncharacterized protein n=1 Tax=Patellaria atrata CBS 101060 TaxID=1346257 RepID=A0A9P4SHG6_9PEZI|nr:hypothetical protein M501DRAFT_22302 [Patellaria atrata CBS 101060]